MSNSETYEVKVYDTGTVVWKQSGVVHRVDGPAITYIGHPDRWYLFGIEMSKTKHQAAVAAMNCVSKCAGKIISIDGIEYTLVPKTV